MRILSMTVLLFAWLSLPIGIQAQTAEQKARDIEVRPLSAIGGAGEWRHSPQFKPEADTVPSEDRRLRNSFWQLWLPPTNAFVAPPQRTGLDPEIPEAPSDIWVVGSFESYRTLEPSPGRGPYTEIQLKVREAFGGNPTQLPSVGSQIDVGEAGGTVADRSGAVRSYNLHLDPYPFEQHHVYLMLLSRQIGGFYLVDRKWDVTSGKALPSGVIEVDLYIDGKSGLAGRPLGEILNDLRSSPKGNR